MRNTAKVRILVVEDDQSVLSTITTMLNLKGYEAEAACDGFDALMRLKDNVPDLIVSDLNMPQMSGFELLSVVRRRYPQIKVIAASGAYARLYRLREPDFRETANGRELAGVA